MQLVDIRVPERGRVTSRREEAAFSADDVGPFREEGHLDRASFGLLLHGDTWGVLLVCLPNGWSGVGCFPCLFLILRHDGWVYCARTIVVSKGFNFGVLRNYLMGAVATFYFAFHFA